MDTLTHIVVGAVVGETLPKKSLGKQVLFIGAIAQNIPDIDFISAMWMPPSTYLLAHRGFTHSIIFAVFISILLAFIAKRIYSSHNISLSWWITFFGLQIFLHLFIDLMNVYGIGLLEPFSHYKFSLNTLFVADPLLTVVPLIVLIILLALPSYSTVRTMLAGVALVYCALYLMAATSNKFMVDLQTENNLEKQDIAHQRYFITPTPLNIFLWYIVIENDRGYYLGYRSMFDDGDISFKYYENQPLDQNKITHSASDAQQKDLFQDLKTFSKNYYLIQQNGNTSTFIDLRFGQQFGWLDRDAPFVFQFDLTKPGENLMVIQKGRFSNWNGQMIRKTLQRIGGKHDQHLVKQ